jgi:hypothetical protein
VAGEGAVALLAHREVRDVEVRVVLALHEHPVHRRAGADVHLGHRVGEAGAAAEAHVVLHDRHAAARLRDHDHARMGHLRSIARSAREHEVERLLERDAARRAHDRAVARERGVERANGCSLMST